MPALYSWFWGDHRRPAGPTKSSNTTFLTKIKGLVPTFFPPLQNVDGLYAVCSGGLDSSPSWRIPTCEGAAASLSKDPSSIWMHGACSNSHSGLSLLETDGQFNIDLIDQEDARLHHYSGIYGQDGWTWYCPSWELETSRMGTPSTMAPVRTVPQHQLLKLI